MDISLLWKGLPHIGKNKQFGKHYKSKIYFEQNLLFQQLRQIDAQSCSNFEQYIRKYASIAYKEIKGRATWELILSNTLAAKMKKLRIPFI